MLNMKSVHDQVLHVIRWDGQTVYKGPGIPYYVVDDM